MRLYYSIYNIMTKSKTPKNRKIIERLRAHQAKKKGGGGGEKKVVGGNDEKVYVILSKNLIQLLQPRRDQKEDNTEFGEPENKFTVNDIKSVIEPGTTTRDTNNNMRILDDFLTKNGYNINTTLDNYVKGNREKTKIIKDHTTYEEKKKKIRSRKKKNNS